MEDLLRETKKMKLFVDDLRDPPDQTWVVARSSGIALKMCSSVWPSELALDHDLGGDDTVMVFLKGLYEIWDGTRPIPSWTVHSGNPVGRKNIESYMISWETSRVEPHRPIGASLGVP